MKRQVPPRDYTGVSTHELRALILREVTDLDGFAAKCGIPIRSLYRIMAEEYQFTNLATADLVCCRLGLVLNNELTIVPAGSFASCCRMAADEFWLANEDTPPSQEHLHERARELESLRVDVLGEMTGPQQASIKRERVWQNERYLQRVAS
jgi:hypothetical protein